MGDKFERMQKGMAFFKFEVVRLFRRTDGTTKYLSQLVDQDRDLNSGTSTYECNSFLPVKFVEI